MKKNFKRTLAKVMAVALTVSLVGTAADADAAKKIKLSKKSITVTKGKSKKVTIKNVKAKKVKKLTVKSSKKKIATVKKTGNKKTAFKVTGKKVGSAKITVKVTVKGKKKATKLTLKVKVKKAAAPTTAAPATAAPATQAPASQAPASQAPAQSATPAPTAPATPEPTVAPVPSELPLVLSADLAPAWVTGGSYGTTTFNEDGTVSFDSTPSAADTEGSVYNNGLAFYLNETKDKTDISGFGYVGITVATDAEVKLMTWSGGSDAESFWDKKDTWGGTAGVIDNGDGSKTIIYAVADVFASEGKKSKAVGFTLKSDLNGDAQVFSARTATLYGITLYKDMPEVPATPAPTENPFSEGILLNMNDAFNETLSDVDVTATKDENGYAVTKLNFSGNYQRVFFNLPEDVDAADIAAIEVYADVPAQLASSLFQNDFSKDVDSWWNLAKVNGYPFYAGSGERDEEGGLVARGLELATLSTDGVEISGNGGYFSLGGNGKPDEDADDGGFSVANYYIYGINIVLKDKTETPDVETPEVPEEDTTTVETSDVETSTTETSTTETEDVEDTEEPEVPAEPVVYTINKDIVYDATDAEISGWGGNKGCSLDTAITVKATDTVTALVEVKNADGSTSDISMQLALCTSQNDYYGSRIMEVYNANNADGVTLTLIDGEEITDSVDIVALYTNNNAAVAEGEVVTMTVKTITVTPAE